MKKILRDQSGMALPTVLGIMLVVAILATGMFYFSYNELNFSTMNKEQGQAQYLAKAGVEIAAKAFPGVSGKFFNETDPDGTVIEAPVTATLYLHDGEDGNPVLNSTAEGNRGEVAIKVTRDTRQIENSTGSGTGSTEDVKVWAYEAVATVDGATAKAKGFTLPTAKATTKVGESSGSGSGTVDTEKNMHLNWVDQNGVIKSTLQNEEGTQDVYQNGESISVGGITGIINGWFGTDLGSIDTFATVYNGVVSVDEDDVKTGKISVESSGDKRLFIWAAPAVVVEPQVDLRGARNVGGLAITANTIIFDDEVHLYAGQFEMRTGDLILHPMGGKAQVYFNDTVYLHVGNSRYKLFEPGSVYEFTESVDLLTWAHKNGKVNLGFSNWLRELINDQTTGTLVEVTDPVETMPNTNSLTKVIWE